ncbi:hypothetical protein [Cesiribacter andamanensis]|uniref:Uncharacterized protein n=1 Tax=Cesiribacter andamanensis AMV16 TaxID=1279009 RepID=M7MWV8_9BACT|nr:hypothetical protein [Cesiribacter andamanensis]EMR00903.1 hypothetical protein ADICEAN_03969 [Cesiribacter andamanensis AMV16]
MEMDSTLLDIILYLGYFLVIFALAAAVILPLIKSLDNPKGLLKVAAGIVLLLVIFGIAYALSSGDMAARYPDLTENGSKMIGAAIVTMYILIITAVLSIAVTEVSKFFR